MILYIYIYIYIYIVGLQTSCDKMHEKCRIISLKIIMFGVVEPCNLIGGYQGFSQGILSRSSDSPRKKTQAAPPKHS
jgi:hypothetical protein